MPLFFYYPKASVSGSPLHQDIFTHKTLIVSCETWTRKDSSEKTAVHCFLHRVFSKWDERYLKGMEKEQPPSYAKYCRIEKSRSRVLLDFFVNYVTYLNAFRIQYLTISSLVFRNFRNFLANNWKISLSASLPGKSLSDSEDILSSGNLEWTIR
jgi:hypothetical protein